jgi:hypothetical protein
MSEEFQLFISSTVNDLTPVRKELAKALQQPGRIVRCSEDKNFPVEPGLTSHDACLAVVRRCHGFALLIGTRFGGEYLRQGKSITWREWEEACLTGLTPIVLVNKKTNELCRMIARARSRLQKANPAASVRDLDEVLEKKLKKKLAGYHQAPALQRFVDTLRKGHTDNWVKLDWNGAAGEAIEYIQFNLAVQAAAAERRRRDAVEVLQALGQTLADMSILGRRVAVLLAGIRTRRVNQLDALQGLLEIVESLRVGLFGFAEDDRYTVVVHEVRGDELHPIARAAHRAVPRGGRVWSFGEGHVGRAVQQDQMMVSGDIRQTSAWVRNPATDEEDQRNYVSVLAKPYYRADGKPGGAVTLSSSRVDHFTKPDDSAAQAFDTVVSFINMVMLEVQK